MFTIADEKGDPLQIASIEIADQALVKKFLLPSDKVLELGARYGIVSCLINSILQDKKAHVAVEPDERVWNALETNRQVNRCEFFIVKGFLSEKPLGLTKVNAAGGFGTTSFEDPSSKIPCFHLEVIKKEAQISDFTALVVDCEGCFGRFLLENLILLNSLRIILFEADGCSKPSYNEIRKILKEKGFVEKQKGFHNAWVKE